MGKKYGQNRRRAASSGRFVRFLRTRHGKVIFVLLCVLFLLTGSVLVSGNYLLSKINYTPLDQFGLGSVPSDEVDSLDPNVPVDDNPGAMKFGTGAILSDPNIQNILLIGSDTRGGEKYGRSDSMLMLSVNKKTNQVKMVSFLRDLYVKIDGMQDNRINAAYAYGGPKLLADTIEKNFRVKIDNYVRVDFQSFQKLINLLGGVSIRLTAAEAKELNNNAGTYAVGSGMQRVSAGVNRLNGTTALAYARIRHIDSDFGRTQRQRNVIGAIFQSFKSSNPATLWNVANQILPLVQTDLSGGQIQGLVFSAASLMDNPVEQQAIPAQGMYQSKYIRKMAVLLPDIEKNKTLLWKFIYNR